jgi:hypothetical protein
VSPEERLDWSERVISGWEGHGKPGGTPEHNLRMIGEELARLRGIATAEPDLTARAQGLIKRYERMVSRLKSSMN